MTLYLLRHAEAAPAADDADDAARPLTARGRRQARRAGHVLRLLAGPRPVIWTSPLKRARATAALVAVAWQKRPTITDEPALAPPGDGDALLAALRASQAPAVLLVGHEPFLGQLLGRLIGGTAGGGTPLGKAALACLELRAATPPEAELQWLLTRTVQKQLAPRTKRRS